MGIYHVTKLHLNPALQVILAQLKALEAAERVQDARRGLEEAEEEFLGMVDEQV